MENAAPCRPDAGWHDMLEQEYELSFETTRKPHNPAERENALRLLETVVGNENVEEHTSCVGLKYVSADVVSPSGNEYRVTEAGMTGVLKTKQSKHWWRMHGISIPLRTGTIEDRDFCYELPHSYHPIDTMIAEILLIQTDEDKYLETAN